MVGVAAEWEDVKRKGGRRLGQGGNTYQLSINRDRA